jgi:ABC-type multidrug transport system fused ATPase/permease subunit
MNKLIVLGSQRTLEAEDVYNLPAMSRHQRIFDTISVFWARQRESKGKRGASVSMAFTKAFWTYLLWGNLTIAVYGGITILQPFFVRALLEYITAGDVTFMGISNGIALSILLGVFSLIASFSFSTSFEFLSLCALQWRGSLMTLVYDKSLRLSSASKGSQTIGEMVTYMSADAERIWMAVLFVNWLWLGPAMVIGAMGLLAAEIGISSLSAIAVIFILCFIQQRISKYVGKERENLVKYTDLRVKMTNEVLQGVRVIKYYGWERPMRDKVNEIRNEEVKYLSKYQLHRLSLTAMTYIVPLLATFALFLTFVGLGGQLTVEKVYTVLALLNIIRLPVAITPQTWSFTAEAIISFKRLNEFLNMDEVEQLYIANKTSEDVDDRSSTSHESKAGMRDDSSAFTSSKKKGAYSSEEVLVEIDNADFSWEGKGSKDDDLEHEESIENTEAAKNLRDINLRIHRGEFVAIVGKVGSGKSSLLSALLGNMARTKGSQSLNAKVAFAGQEHWIQNISLAENVLFGSQMDEEKYADVLDASQLSQDVTKLPYADHTSIGERGINLSGGQKARVSIARALYKQEADLFIFDDSLASVDVHVGKAIFREAIMSMLCDKTRVVVLSSNYHLLPHFDRVIVVDGGRIEADGSYDEVIEKYPQYTSVDGESDVKKLDEENRVLQQTETDTVLSPSAHDRHSPMQSGRSATSQTYASITEKLLGADTILSPEVSTRTDSSRRPLSPGKPKNSLFKKHSELISSKRSQSKALMSEEDREKGSVKLSTYAQYFESAVGGGWGYVAFALMLVVFLVSQGDRMMADLWVGIWADNFHEDGDGENTVTNFYYYMFIFFTLSTVFLTMVRTYMFYKVSLGASKTIHDDLLISVLRAPINTYFDVTPIGRILNRFSKDLDSMDSMLPDFFLQLLQNGFYALGIIGICIASTYFFLIILIPLAYFFYKVQDFFRKSSRELKRLDGISRSPMYSFFAETLQGIQTIRAFGLEKQFTKRFFDLADAQMRNWFCFWFANRWLALRLDLFSNGVILSVALLCVIISDSGGYVDPNLLGLALVYSLQLIGFLQWTVRVMAETETYMTSVERLLAFNKIVPEEPTVDVGTKSTSMKKKSISHDGDTKGYEMALGTEALNESFSDMEWPAHGSILIRNLKMRYRPGLDLVLKGVNLDIPAGAKVGVVGRTGAGKSSLMLALFRIVQPEEGSSIIIDDVDTLTMRLSVLRSRLTIIPQDPVMFSGTLRSNLDPFKQYTDMQIWEALARAHLKDDIISKFEKKLDHEVMEQGSNISVGQRQLLCIARALLRRSKVIVMDEVRSRLKVYSLFTFLI